MPRKIIDEEFKKAVWKQGFLFENEVLNKFEKAGWIVLPNQYFRETKESTVKEYDLLTFKRFTPKDSEFKFFVFLIVECKYNPYKIVFYVRNLENREYLPSYFTGEDFLKFYPHETIKKIFENIKQHRDFFFSKEQVFGYQSFLKLQREHVREAKKKKFKTKYIYKPQSKFTEETVFKAIDTISSAARYEKAIFQGATIAKKWFIIILPLVIFSGKLYKATISKKRKTLKKEKYFKYRIGKSSLEKEKLIPEEYYVHIIDIQDLGRFVRVCNYIFNNFKNNIKSILDKKTNLQEIK